MLYSIRNFGGTLPRIEPRLLQESNSQVATNLRLRSGGLRPFRSPSTVEKLPIPSAEYQTLYQYDVDSDTSVFIYSENDLDFAKGPVADDEFNRVYVTGLDTFRVFDSTTFDGSSSIIDSTNSYKVAIPAGAAATLTETSTGSGDAVTRAYLYTYSRKWDDGKFDEGQPSSPATHNGETYIDTNIGSTITISDIADAPSASDNGVNRISIYRTAVATSAVEYELVIDFDIAEAKAGNVTDVTWDGSTFSYEDTKNDEDLGALLKSLTWAAPQEGLRGLISLNNGCFAAFKGNTVYFSEPYQVHAWPIAYTVTVDNVVKGLGSFGNMLVVLTEDNPVLINAQNPSVLVPQPMKSRLPCLSKKSIVNFNNSVYYASSDGLVNVSSNGAQTITTELMTTGDWQRFAPDTFIASIQEGRYIAFYRNANTNSDGLFILDLVEAMGGISTSDIGAFAMHVDTETNDLYYITKDSNGSWSIKEWDALEESLMNFRWRSKVFVSEDSFQNLAGARVRAEFLSAEVIARYNEALAELAKSQIEESDASVGKYMYNTFTFAGDANIAAYSLYSFTPSLMFKFICDGKVVLTKEIMDSSPFRLPSGLVADSYEIELSGNVPVHQVDIATSIRELR